MEVISCCTDTISFDSTAVRSNARPARVKSNVVQYPYRNREALRTFVNESLARKTHEVEETENERIFPAAVAVFLYLFILVSVPLAVMKSIPIVSSRLNAYIPFQVPEMASEEFNFLNNAMNRFALHDDYEIDDNGNVVLEDGTVLSADDVYSDTVTYSTYTVKSGDNIGSITYGHKLRNISTLIAVNDIENVRMLRAGQKLKIPSMDGLVHTVASGDTLATLSEKYNVSVEKLLDTNDLSSESLSLGQKLFIPGAKLEGDALRKAMGELFVYPITASWRLTSKFGKRSDPFSGIASYHYGIDMACPTGTPVKAAMSGKILFVGYNNLYGNYVIIDHFNGYQTLYGHMSKTIVKKGQNVGQGEQVGMVGSTGQATGPHLHFTVYKKGVRVDPLPILQGKKKI